MLFVDNTKVMGQSIADGGVLRQSKAVIATTNFFIFVQYEARIDPYSERAEQP